MTKLVEPALYTVSADRVLARLGASHGYRFDGDSVQLRATFPEVPAAAHQHAWALQLWACVDLPADAETLGRGHLVAEAWLPPLAEIAGPSLEFDIIAAATPPAGSAAWVMVLALVAAPEERFEAVHDFSVYPRPEYFVLPRLQGEAGYRIVGDCVQVSVGGIENPRDARNISGTLSVELWALRAPYHGGRFEGFPLAGASLGTLPGQENLRALDLDLAFTPPPAGTWHPVVMLREWVGTGYVTRDFATFAQTLVIAPPAVAPVAVEPALAKKRAARKAPVAAGDELVDKVPKPARRVAKSSKSKS